MQGILIPIDFSPCSLNALKYGVNLARKLGTNVNVIHGYHVPIPAAEFSMSISAGMIKEFKDDAIAKFEALKKDMPSLQDLPVTFNVKMAFALDAILSSINDLDTDLVVMGTKGSSGISEVVLGSNTSGVIKNSGVPVMAIPQDHTSGDISKIILACDFEPIENLSNLKIIKRLVELDNASVDVVHVSKDTSPSVEHSKQALEMDKFFGDMTHEFHYLNSDNIADALEDFIDHNNMDLIAMIPRKHNLIDRLFKPSVTKKMANHCKIPLLAIPA